MTGKFLMESNRNEEKSKTNLNDDSNIEKSKLTENLYSC